MKLFASRPFYVWKEKKDGESSDQTSQYAGPGKISKEPLQPSKAVFPLSGAYGVENCDREYGEITERANLERKILCDSYGTDPFALHKECPACTGKMIAGIRNRSWEEQNGDAVDFDENGTDINNDAVFVDESSVQLREDPIYQCLQRGKKF